MSDTLEQRLASVEKFIVTKAASFCRTLTARERANYDQDDVESELRLAIIQQDAGWDPEKGAYTTYVASIIHHCFSHLRDRANTVESPPNSTSRLKEYQLEEDCGSISSRRQKTADDIRRTKFGIMSIDSTPKCYHSVDCRDSVYEWRDLELESPPSLERNAQEDEVRTEMRRLAVKAVRALRPIEAWLLGSLYGLWGREPQTLGEIAAKSGRSPEKLRNLKSSALTKLRERIGDQAEAYLNTLED